MKSKNRKTTAKKRKLPQTKQKKSILNDKELFQRITEHVDDLIAVVDVKGRRLYSSPSYRKIFGDPAVLQDSDSFQEIHPEDRDRVKKIFQESIKTGIGRRAEYRFLLNDGTIRHIESRGSVLHDHAGKTAQLVIISHDITERKSSDTSQRLLAHALSCTKDCFCLSDLQDNFLFVNPAFCETYGYREEELLGKNISLVRSPDLPGEVARSITESTIDGGWNGEVVNRRKDGSLFNVELWTSVVRDEAGKPIAFVGVARDITERKRVEEALQKTISLFTSTLESTADGVLVVDTSGKVITFNKKFIEMWQVPESLLELRDDEELIQYVLDQLLDPQGFQQKVKDLYRNPEAESHDILEFRDGRVFDRFSFPQRIEGKSVGRVWSFHDITERRQSELQLKRSEAKYRLLFESNPEAMWVFDDETLRFLAVNDAAIARYGYSYDEFMSMTIQDIRPRQDHHGLKKYLDEHGRGVLTVTGFQHQKRDGAIIDVEILVHPIEFAGRQAKLVTAKDITERRRVEKLQEAVYQINQAADKSQDLNELFKELHGIIQTVMPAKNFYIALYDENEDMLSFPYFVDEVDTPEPPQKLGRGLTAYVLRTGKSLLCTKEVDEQLQRSGEVELIGASSPIWLGVPLIVEHKTIGVMTVQHYSDPNAYGKNEQQILEFVSSQVAGAIHRKRAEDALRESEERYRTVAETASDAIISINGESKILFINSAAEKIFGYSVTEMIGHDLTMLMPEYLRHVHQASMKRYIETGKKHISWASVELPGLHKNGNEIPLELSFGEFIRDGQHIFTGIVRDITERKRIESSLRESEARLRSLVTNAPVVLFAVDQDGIFTMSEGKGLTALGLRSGEIVGRSVFDAYKDVPEVIQNIRLALSGQTFTTTVHVQGLLFETHYTPVFGPEGIVTGVIGVATDITDRHRAEELQEAVYKIAQADDQSTTLEGLFHNVHEIILTVMPAKNFYIALYDEKEQMVSFPYFVDEADAPPPPQKLGRGLTEYILRTGKSLLCDKLVDAELQRQGEVEVVGVSAPIWLGVPLIIENKTIGVMTVQHYADPNAFGARELHILEFVSSQIAKAIEKKRSEEALRQSEGKYRTLFEESQDGIFLSTSEGKLIDVNPAGVELFGYSSKEELLKTNIAEDLYYNPADRDTFVKRMALQSFVVDFEFEIKTKNGERRVVLESASAIMDEHRRIVSYRGFLRDITERKKLEEQLRQVQKMESIGTLAGGIAHDFNNLLGIILGYTSLLEDQTLDAEAISQNVQTIKKAVERGAGLVRQLLTFARKSETWFESVAPNETIWELVKMLSQTFPKSIRIATDLDETLPSIVADSGQLHQALLNLCVNARDSILDREKLGPHVGSLLLKTNIVRAEQLREKFQNATAIEYLVITVQDNGMGINEETLNRIFEPFFTTKELGKGTGLGLSVVYGVVNNHHGFIDLESEVGKGTTFYLYLPVQEQGIKKVITDGEEPGRMQEGFETVLIVEDEEMLLNLVKSLLEERGYSVLTAKDGQEGINIYREHHQDIACVLTDMGLPRLGGWEMFMKMKECNPKVKAILASGYCDPRIRAEMINEGAKDFIQKPYVSDIVLKRIREVIDTL